MPTNPIMNGEFDGDTINMFTFSSDKHKPIVKPFTVNSSILEKHVAIILDVNLRTQKLYKIINPSGK